MKRRITIDRHDTDAETAKRCMIPEGPWFHAMFALGDYAGVCGCPLGQGSTPEAAARDLLSRTNSESTLDIRMSDVELENER